MRRPGTLLLDLQAGKIDVVVVYKVDRLTRSLMDFAKLVELFDRHGVSFVSVTQSFNTTSSMGRLTLNVLLSFAEFEREVIGERVRDKISASKRKGISSAPASHVRSPEACANATLPVRHHHWSRDQRPSDQDTHRMRRCKRPRAPFESKSDRFEFRRRHWPQGRHKRARFS